ncbi:MAG: GGDEF domain-containing protein [Bythopirellula sp.]
MDILQQAWPFIFLSLLGLCGLVGLLAVISPKMFALVAETGGLQISKPHNSSLFEPAINIDQYVMRHSRQFGTLVTLIVVYLALCYFGRVDPSWTPNFLLFIVCVSFCMASSSLVELGGQLSKIEHKLAEARIDALTGLANRRAFDEELERRLSERSRTGVDFCVSILDIDHFKEVNDKYGHLAGDNVLAEGVAEVIKQSKRSMDLAARYGGDEFVIIYPAFELAEAAASADRLRSEIAARQFPFDDVELTIHVSVGVAEATSADDVASLLDRADKALYAAKQAGRNKGFQHDGTTCQLVEVAETEPHAATMESVVAG